MLQREIQKIHDETRSGLEEHLHAVHDEIHSEFARISLLRRVLSTDGATDAAKDETEEGGDEGGEGRQQQQQQQQQQKKKKTHSASLQQLAIKQMAPEPPADAPSDEKKEPSSSP